MRRHEESPAVPRTRLALARMRAGFTQKDMAERTGITLPTYRRLERGALPRRDAPNPPLRYLINCAIVLGVQWQEFWEPEWEGWLDLGVPEPTSEDRVFWENVAYMWPDVSDDDLVPWEDA